MNQSFVVVGVVDLASKRIDADVVLPVSPAPSTPHSVRHHHHHGGSYVRLCASRPTERVTRQRGAAPVFTAPYLVMDDNDRRFPLGPHDVILDEHVARNLDLGEGDEVSVVLADYPPPSLSAVVMSIRLYTLHTATLRRHAARGSTPDDDDDSVRQCVLERVLIPYLLSRRRRVIHRDDVLRHRSLDWGVEFTFHVHSVAPATATAGGACGVVDDTTELVLECVFEDSVAPTTAPGSSSHRATSPRHPDSALKPTSPQLRYQSPRRLSLPVEEQPPSPRSTSPMPIARSSPRRSSVSPTRPNADQNSLLWSGPESMLLVLARCIDAYDEHVAGLDAVVSSTRGGNLASSQTKAALLAHLDDMRAFALLSTKPSFPVCDSVDHSRQTLAGTGADVARLEVLGVRTADVRRVDELLLRHNVVPLWTFHARATQSYFISCAPSTSSAVASLLEVGELRTAASSWSVRRLPATVEEALLMRRHTAAQRHFDSLRIMGPLGGGSKPQVPYTPTNLTHRSHALKGLSFVEAQLRDSLRSAPPLGAGRNPDDDLAVVRRKLSSRGETDAALATVSTRLAALRANASRLDVRATDAAQADVLTVLEDVARGVRSEAGLASVPPEVLVSACVGLLDQTAQSVRVLDEAYDILTLLEDDRRLCEAVLAGPPSCDHLKSLHLRLLHDVDGSAALRSEYTAEWERLSEVASLAFPELMMQLQELTLLTTHQQSLHSAVGSDAATPPRRGRSGGTAVTSVLSPVM